MCDYLALIEDGLTNFKTNKFLDTLCLQQKPLLKELFFESVSTPDNWQSSFKAHLLWCIQKLSQSPKAKLQRMGETLKLYYIEELPASVVLEKLKISEDTFERYLKEGPKELKQIFEQLKPKADLEQRQQYYVSIKYQTLPEAVQKFLSGLVLCRHPFKISELTKTLKLDVSTISLEKLAQLSWINWDEQTLTATINPILKKYEPALTPNLGEKIVNYRLLAIFYEQKQNYIEASFHYYQAKEYKKSVLQLIASGQFGGPKLPIPVLKEHLKMFTPAVQSLLKDDRLWASLKLLTGRVYEVTDKLKQAIAEFEQATQYTKNALIQAEAYFWLGRCYRQLNKTQAFDNYQKSLEILKSIRETESARLQIRVYISQAWVFFEQQKQYDTGLEYLKKAEDLIPRTHRKIKNELLAELHNACGELYGQQGHKQEEQKHRKLATFYFDQAEIVDIEQKINLTYNFGNSLCWDNHISEARHYFQIGQQAAEEAGIYRKEALFQKGLGMCAFFEGNYSLAIEHYLKACHYFRQTNNWAALQSCLFDVCEAYLEDGEVVEAQMYYREYEKIQKNLETEQEEANFKALKRKFPELSLYNLSPEQMEGLKFLQKNGYLTNSKYCEVTGVSKNTATLHLQDLVDKGICQVEGQGPNRKYIRSSAQSNS